MMTLRTDKQLVADFGLPSVRTVRTMRQKGLPAVRLGKAYLYDPQDVSAFIAQRKVSACPAQTEDRISNSSSIAAPSTFTGVRAAERASDRRALQTVEKLKQLSPTSSKVAEAPSEQGLVIRANFSRRGSNALWRRACTHQGRPSPYCLCHSGARSVLERHDGLGNYAGHL